MAWAHLWQGARSHGAHAFGACAAAPALVARTAGLHSAAAARAEEEDDGDRAAAYRYTECRLRPLAEELLADIDKNTVNMRPNFDESLMEPVVLPARVPNLLVNGSTGIAVGMATNIPPHNLTEVIDGVIAFIENPEISIEEICEYIKGPDFPTGGTIYGLSAVRDLYMTGRGKIKVRGKATIEEDDNGKSRIIITEIPYALNKTLLIQKIVHLVREKKLEGISDLRDESGKDGIRLVVELKKSAVPNVLLNNLFKFTQLESTFGGIMLAIDKGKPRVMNIKEVLKIVSKMGVNRLMVEGGASVWTSFLKTGYFDEIVMFTGSKIINDSALSCFNDFLPPDTRLGDFPNLTLTSLQNWKDDIEARWEVRS